MAIQIIDTSIKQRHIHTTNAWVETDIVDASGNYKPFEKYDTVKIGIDPSAMEEQAKKTRFMDHIYVDPSVSNFGADPSLSETYRWDFIPRINSLY